MKTIAAPAMAAIEAGEAIVTGAVKITPVMEQTTLISVDDVWLYHTEAPGSPADYSAAAFDDSGWASDVGGFGNDPPGADYPPANTVLFGGVSPITEGSIIWLRHHFGPLESADIELTVYHDDGCQVWFNDDAVALTPLTAYSSSGTIDAADVDVSGDNVIAIKVTDSVPSGSPVGIYAAASLTQGVSGDAEPICLWGGYGPIEIDGDEYQGIGARGLAQQSGGAVGGIAQGLMLTVSGVEPAALELLDADEIKGAPAVLYRMIFAGDGKTLLDAHVFDRGRIDTVDTDETIGGQATINVAVESAARGLGRSGARRRADSDQRLIDPDDGYFKNTSYAGQKTLYWGGKRPRYGSAG